MQMGEGALAGNAGSYFFFSDNRTLLSPPVLPGLPFGCGLAPCVWCGTVSALNKTSAVQYICKLSLLTHTTPPWASSLDLFERWPCQLIFSSDNTNPTFSADASGEWLCSLNSFLSSTKVFLCGTPSQTQG